MRKKKKGNIFKQWKESIESFFSDKRIKNLFGISFIFVGIFMFASFTSFLFNGHNDQDKIGQFSNEILNVGGSLGHYIAYHFLYLWFGISSFIIPLILLNFGIYFSLNRKLIPLKTSFFQGIIIIVWISLFFGFFSEASILCGIYGSELNKHLNILMGKIGTGFLITFSFLVFVILKYNPNLGSLIKKINLKRTEEENEIITTNTEIKNEVINPQPELIQKIDPPTDLKFEEPQEQVVSENIIQEKVLPTSDNSGIDIAVNVNEEEVLSQEEIKNKLENLGEYDPKLDLSNYISPGINLLQDYGSGKIEIDKSELEENKNRIVETLANYKIGISSISATIGPTITLYEIVPEAGIRISKIKNLEDDIALSLSALGIRIIAPIPGRGTIGIEVPNQKPATVSMKTVIASDKFQNSDMELPVAIGKTISNETFVADLTKMPHLLMAGATGQGKSVGLNAILASLLYKKHPSQVKFVLVDPKKVELTLFNKIERHFLAKLPDTDEAIITDTKKVINTLNSLCIEMDQRYDLLQNAHCRNIVEYNKKFIARKLNPNDGHKYLPYIVLVIDEFADLIMTAGKEVETPIARLAQLARAIGIHLIVATQRPSVNVITGIIKANFPARVAFRVTSKIDSRTILDAGGADQLIGRGDMLISLGNELVRLQCAFIDTPEVEKITDFIGNQRAYPEAFMLPEYVGDAEGGSSDADLDDRDVMFEEAARLIVQHQSGSTSLIQRKLKLGYNRAGRIIDQLETARIVGPFEGSKARQVLVRDEFALEEILKQINNTSND